MVPRAARALLSAAVALALVAGAAAASPAVSFADFPARLVQGQSSSVLVATSASAGRCSLAVRYADGRQAHRLARIRAGVARFALQVPKDAAPGRAQATVGCARAGSVSRGFLVVGSVVPPRIDVLKQGFSIRPRTTGSTVSYGLLLANRSQTQDALDVSVLVNFVDASDKLVGSASGQIPTIGAGETFAYGSSLSFPAAAPVARLEVVIQVHGRQPKQLLLPAVANVHLDPSLYDKGWLGDVAGEIVNGAPKLVLQSAQLSVVVLDAGGNVIGGGSGLAFASLPPGAREFFTASSGFDAISLTNAASAVVSVSPTYQQPGI